jgi:hypothetical protein
MPVKYRQDKEWCDKILSDLFEISIDDLEWVRKACRDWYVDREMPDP